MSDLYKEDNDTEFEVRFLEGILKHNPHYIEGLIILGDFYTQQGRFADGLKIDERLSLLQPHDPGVHYNLACSYALVNEIDKAFRSIKKAVRLGYHNFDHLEHDPDLANLRLDRRFQEYYARLKRNLSAAAAQTMSEEEEASSPLQDSDEIIS